MVPLGLWPRRVRCGRKQTTTGPDDAPIKEDQTRRRLDGRTPLCGIEVTSRIDVMWKPTACRARECALTARTRALDLYFERTDAVLGGLLARILSCNLGSIRGRLA
jgi:hypothetical protein